MRKIYSLVIALMVFLSITLSAVAFEQKTITRENAEYGYAFWSDDNTPYGILFVTKNTSVTSIDVFACTADNSCLSGSTETHDSVFNVGKQFQSATLTAPIWLSICSPVGICEEAEGSIQAEWTGYGELQRSVSQFISHDGGMFKSSGISSSRLAIATMSITIGGKIQQTGNSFEGGLGKAKNVYMNFSK